MKPLAKVISVLIVVLFSTASAQLCRYADSYFLNNNGVKIVDVRIEDQVIGGQWANITVTESSKILIKDESYHPCQRYAFFPDEFYLIAVTDSDTINCPYWAAELDDQGRGEKLMDYSWHSECWHAGVDANYILVHGNMHEFVNGTIIKIDTTWIDRDDTVIPNTWEYKYSTTGLERNLVWQTAVPEGDSLKIFLGNDLIAYEYKDTSWASELSDTLWGEGRDNCGNYWGSWGAYLTDPNGYGLGAWDSFGPFYVPDPQPIGVPGEVRFEGYVCSTSTGGIADGVDWLPDTVGRGKWIGLKFSFTDVDTQVSNRPVYEIFDITTWQGVNMNTPLKAPRPVAVGDCTYFDYWVDNPMIDGEPKYTIRTIDKDIWLDDLGDGWGSSRPTVDTISVRRYTVQRNAEVKSDILWLQCRDFAAHAIVLPRTGQTSPLRLRNHVSPYDSSLPLWSVSVPRDNDGYRRYGSNRGDFLADAWEESALGVAQKDPIIHKFFPFYCWDNSSNHRRIVADCDSFPTGRGITGDRFTNWEEYRGFSVTGVVDTIFTSPQIRRTDPRHKTVMVDWKQIKPDTCVSKSIPAWLSQLISPDSSRLDIKFVNLNLDLDTLNGRFSTKRVVNPNQYGAYFPYLGVTKVTNRPANFEQNAISWWIMNQAERDWYRRRPNGGDYNANGILGVCWPDMNALRMFGFQTPEIHSRIVINSDYINSYEFKQFYANHPNRWLAERDSLYRNTMTHEFGHSIGMMHLEDNHIMKQYPPVQSFDPTRDDYGRFFFDPAYTPKYSNSNKGQIQTKVK